MGRVGGGEGECANLDASESIVTHSDGDTQAHEHTHLRINANMFARTHAGTLVG